jgi:acetyltransferase
VYVNDGLTIRRIDDGDASSLLQFYNGLSEESKRTFRPLGLETTLDVCEAIIRDNQAAMDDKLDLVALQADCLVGWGFLHQLQSQEPFFGLAIADEWQGRGQGGALMDAVMAAARTRGLAKVTLTVVQDNDAARAMYERRGFVRNGEFVGGDGLAYYRMLAELDAKEKT